MIDFSGLNSVIASAFIGMIIWLIKLGSRVSVLEALSEGMSERLERIEDKLDRVLNGRVIVTEDRR